MTEKKRKRKAKGIRNLIKKRKIESGKEKSGTYFDYNLLFLIIFLICFGLVMLYSTSSYTSANKYGDSMYYLKRQLLNVSLGGVAMAITTMIDYRFWKKIGGLIYVVSAFLCLATHIPGLGSSSHGSGRWLQIGPIRFQPSEIAKIAIIIFLAMLLERVANALRKGKNLFIVFVLIAPLVIVVAITNLSTAIIILGIAICMLFIASPKSKHFVVVFFVTLVSGILDFPG